MSGDVTRQALERLSHMPDSDNPAALIAAQNYYDVEFTGGDISGVTIHNLGTPLPIADGGTGQATANGALNALLPSQGGNSGKTLKTDGTNTSWATDTTGITQLTGDVTAGPGSGSQATTLATVNSNVGTFGSSTSIPNITVTAKGLVTAAGGNSVIAPAGTLSGTTLAATVVTSSLTSTGTLIGGATGAGFTIALGTSTITGNLATSHGGTGAASLAAAGIVTTSDSHTVTNAMLTQMAANTIKGNNTGSIANAADLTIAQIQAMLGVAYNSIGGCLISSITGNSTTAAFTVGTGQATDSTNATYITSAGYSWAATNGNAINGTDAASSTLANSTTYHVFLISGVTGTGTFVSASLTPTFPTGYTTYKRRIGSFNTTGAGAPIPYLSRSFIGGASLNWLTTQVLDVNVSNLSTSRTLYTLSVPTGIQVQPILRYSGLTGGNTTIVTSPDETDVAPAGAASTVPGYDYADSASAHEYFLFLTTNTSGQIGVRASGSSTPVAINTRGWIDGRVS